LGMAGKRCAGAWRGRLGLQNENWKMKTGS
jgi:hypothetical protein